MVKLLNSYDRKLVIIFLLLFSPIFNQTLNINNILIEGNSRLSDDDIVRISGIFPGMEYDQDRIQKGITKLWDLNRFNDIQILVENENQGLLDIVIQVDEAIILDEVLVSGNRKINDKKIIELSALEKGRIITDKDIFDSKVNIIDKYKEKGYHEIQISDSLIESNKESASNLSLSIKEGPKIKIKEIRIEGADKVKKWKVKSKLKKTKEWKWYLPWRGKYSKSNMTEDNNNLNHFFKKNGYKDFFIIDNSVDINDKDMIVQYNLHEGPKYIYRNFLWNGNNIISDKELNKALDIQINEKYDYVKFNSSLYENVYSLYMDRGYLNLNLTHEFKHVSNDTIDVSFNLIENNIVKVRKIIIKGNFKTNENVIRREIDIYPGDVFNRSKFIEVRSKIMLLNFFENVLPDIKVINSDEIDLIIKVEEKGVGQANFSMGWNKAQGFNGGGGFQLPNLMGKGQTISLSYNRTFSNSSGYTYSNSESSSVAQSFSVSFFEPAIFDTPNMIGISLSYSEVPSNRTISGLDLNSFSSSISFGKRKLRWPDDKFKVTWVITNSQRKYSSQELNLLTNSFPEEDIVYSTNKYFFESKGVSISQVLKRRSLNHPEFPTNGSEFSWDFTYSGGIMGGIENYIKNLLSFNWYVKISEKMTIANKIKFGDINKTSENSIIPHQRYFMMGGSGIPNGEMLRGYPENSIGPYYYESNYPVGGKILARFSVEYRLLLSEMPTMFGFVFADAGNVWSGYDFVDPFDLKRSCGIGIRLFMPMLGLIGYDIGYGFDPSSYGDGNSPWGWDHHLIFGTTFN